MENFTEILDLEECVTFQCKFCNFQNKSRESFTAHVKSHLPNLRDKILNDIASLPDPNVAKERFVCSLCYDIFATKEDVRDHMINDHKYKPTNESDNVNNVNKDKNPSIVKSINEQESLPDDWDRISLKALKKKLKKGFIIKCSIKGCPYTFETPENQLYHEKCHRSNSPDQVMLFKCGECQMEMKNWQICTNHMWKEHKVNVDLLKCPFCDFPGSTAQIFRHLRVHSKIKEFACSDCPKMFKKFSQLRVHAITHIEGDKKGEKQMRWYSQKNCDICGNLFSNSKILSKHIKVVHNKIKPFICSICGHKSARKVSWLIHIRQHTGEKPLTCKFCDFKAADPSVITKHELRHTRKSNAPYKCPDCDYVSIQSGTLKSHLKKYHPNSYKVVVCDQCSFVSVNMDILNRHKQNHKSGVIPNEDSNEISNQMTKSLPESRSATGKPNQSVEISSDCFLPLESTDSLVHDPPVDTGGVTIPAHSEETQFPCFMNN